MKFWKAATKSDRTLLLWSSLFLALSFSLLALKSNQVRASAVNDEEFLRFVDMAAEVYTEIRGKYVDEVAGREVLEGALRGMFLSLDEHSQYMDPRMLDSLNKDTGGEFSGIGIHITKRQGLLTVIAPLPGSPAARVGLLPWDRIIEIEGESTEGMALSEAVEKLTGPSGTQVTIKVFRENEPEPLEFSITRASIRIESVHSTMKDDRIGYIRIARFSGNTTEDLKRAVLDLKAEGMESLILDLRFNTGGLLRESIDVADLFVPKNELILSQKGRLRSQNREYRARTEPIVSVPMFVLVNEGSASASEIVAGALQDHNVAVVIGPAGQNTFGKGSVQTIEPLRHTMYEDEDGNRRESAIRITTARYYLPSGTSIDKTGITPDVGIPLPANHERELIRLGAMLGDTHIPLSEEELQQMHPELEEENGLRIQRRQQQLEQEMRDEQPEDPTGESEDGAQVPRDGTEQVPFYSDVRRPQVEEAEDFVDILLEEALKQMKIYMILDSTRRERPRVADAGGRN